MRDLLRRGDQKKASLRVREHPEKGPYVQGECLPFDNIVEPTGPLQKVLVHKLSI